MNLRNRCHQKCEININGVHRTELDELIEQVCIYKNINQLNYADITLRNAIKNNKRQAQKIYAEMQTGDQIIISAVDTTATELFEGVLMSINHQFDQGESIIVLSIIDRAVKLKGNKNFRIFINKSDEEIIHQICDEQEISLQVDAITPSHEQLLQYQQTDWSFLLQRAKETGCFIANNRGQLQIYQPHSSSLQTLEIIIDKYVKYDLSVTINQQIEGCAAYGWSADDQEMVESSTATTTPLKHPLISEKSAEIAGGSSYKISSNQPHAVDQLEMTATAKEQLRKLDQIQGTITIPTTEDIQVGCIACLEGEDHAMQGEMFVGGVMYTYEEHMWISQLQIGLPEVLDQNQDEALNATFIGIVKALEGDPMGQFRIAVTLPSFQQDDFQVWARMAHQNATLSAGSWIIPSVNDEVLLTFLDGKMESPVIIGSLYNKVNTPSDDFILNDDNFIRGWLSPNKLKIIMDDELNAITIETTSGNKITLNDKEESVQINDMHGNESILNKEGISLHAVKDINFTAKADINLSAAGKLTVEASQDIAIEGMNINHKAASTLVAEAANLELKGSGQTIIKGGIVMIN
ncbi:phage baseplate assembly protein V [Persicobacter psychrovividus]|uniref:Gp5/Type VI secretion system Vgr protein OB-fold domain-containing protein n=1 Tax=Persicobacter psychrovividus TaxID=387638 RepID=A0ABN6LDT8_9BACT|nr:hypothetical protein PEPS_36300 [Persicobacter psychrovividus]